MGAVSHNGRVLARLRASGYTAETVEHWNAHTRRKHDLFGVIDVLGVGPAGTLAVQVTSRAHIADRVAKIQASEALPAMLAAGWRVQVWGYDKPEFRWRVKVVDVV